MPKFLIEGAYTAAGFQSLARDKASGRIAMAKQLLAAYGGTLEAAFYALGETHVFMIVEAPDLMVAAAGTVAVSGLGLIQTKVTPLLTVEEMDQAIEKSLSAVSLVPK